MRRIAMSTTKNREKNATVDLTVHNMIMKVKMNHAWSYQLEL
jgi:hypothetical protein